MPNIELNNINKHICRDVNLKIRDRELLVLLGANGSGKTTLLNIIAGLTDYGGSVRFDGMVMDNVAASRRQVSYLFEKLVLFPHLDVTANIAYGLRAQKQTTEQTATRVKELLQMMRISHLAERYPKHLSGGEKQRVALARALAVSPKVLLLDEPLSSLDAKSAKYLRVELKQIHRRLGITTVYVTHNLQEAEEMADRIAIIQNGHLEQVGRPEEIFFYPESESVSDFIGAPNIIECDGCNSVGHGVMEVSCGGVPITVPHDGDSIKRIALFPSDIYVSETRPPGPELNRFSGTITSIKPVHDVVRIEVKVGENSLLAEMPHHLFDGLNLTTGKDVFVILKMGRIRIYEKKNP